MAKLPAFQFYPGDWFKDPELRSCSLAARGAWFEILCLMAECKPIGLLSTNGERWDEDRLAAAIGGCDSAVTSAIEELKSKGVLRRNSQGFFYSKRMVLLEKERKKWRNRKKKQRDRRRGRHAVVSRDVTRMSSPSSSSSSPSKLSSHGGHHQDQVLRGDPVDRLDDFRKNVLSRSEDSDGILATALDIIVDRIRQSGVNVNSPKYLEVALANFDFQQGDDREQLMQRLRRRRN